MLKIYGIKNCNSVKKAFDFLAENGIEYEFHDYKKLGIDEKTLRKFIAKFGFDKVLNKKGTTYRKLDEAEKKLCENEEAALKLMREKTSLIKRPIILGEKMALIGFDEDSYRVNL